MSTINAQRQIIQDVSSVKYITGALRDISAIELQHLRETFQRNRMFFAELQYLYQLVWRIAAVSGNEALLTSNKKRVIHVAYTTNKHFYGSLNDDVMRLFVQSTDPQDACMVIGRTGEEIWRAAPKKRKDLQYVVFDDDAPSKKETLSFLDTVQAYERVYLYYPKFTSVYQQQAELLDITFRPTKAQLRKQSQEDLPQYFLEPDLKDMVTFFNSQVRYVLFQRMLLETQLSRVSARLVRMDMADHNAADILKKEQHELGRAFRSFFNNRMLETVTGYVQWHKTNE